MMTKPAEFVRLSTGIPDLDVILKGGLPANRLYLLEGYPGTGKTTIALQFLIAGQRTPESKALYITMSESEEELCSTAASHGWDISNIEIFNLIPDEARLDHAQTVFVGINDGGRTLELLQNKIKEVNPDRLIIDSIADLRLMAHDPLFFRRQLLAIKKFVENLNCTTWLLDDMAGNIAKNVDMHSLVSGVVALEQTERLFGTARRRLRVVKLRGSDFQSGWHDFIITQEAVYIFPSIIEQEHHRSTFAQETCSTGRESLDAMLGGGFERGTVTMIVGPSGVGKSSLSIQSVLPRLQRGERVAYFSFDESFELLFQRCHYLGFSIEEYIGKNLGWQKSIPSRLTPGRFIWDVRREIEKCQATVIVIDNLNSYLATMIEEREFILQMHELVSYLNNMGVITLISLTQQGTVGDLQNPIDLSFLSDTIVTLRYFETRGSVRKAISVIKKRTSPHTTEIRELRISPAGVVVGSPLINYQGILTGNLSEWDQD